MKFLLLISLFIYGANAKCSNNCSGNGICLTTGECSCFNGYMAADCSQMSCPIGIAWTDFASATDTAHANAECSNAGICSRTTGICTCRTGFAGPACDRLTCPGTNCNGHGICISMGEFASYVDNYSYAYAAATTYSLWDATKILGCVCESGWTGYDCSVQTCVNGDDPMTTGQVNQIQAITYTGSTAAGIYYLTFGSYTTTALLFSASAATIQTALQALPNLGANSLTVTASHTTTTISIQVTFLTIHGSPPLIKFISYTFANGGTPPTTPTTAFFAITQAGTTESAQCSNRGICSTSGLGQCTCGTGFAGSDGTGSGLTAGTTPDCGYISTSPTSCQISASNGYICSGHGTCSGATTYACTCFSGYTGFDCSLQTCPFGYAWFDKASATNTAHALAECSNRGICNRFYGTCTCQSGFVGEACQRLDCPVTNNQYCSGYGTCQSMKYLATLATDDDGNNLAITYGDTPNQAATWDAAKMQGCYCDQGGYLFGSTYGYAYGYLAPFTGYDCSLRQCPYGDDPTTTGGVNEVQAFTCTGTSGSFYLSFKGKTTTALAYSATAATVQAALQLLTTVGQVTVTFSSGTKVCASGGITTSVTFLTTYGDLPLLAITPISGLTFSTVTETVVCTKESAECSNHGICDRTLGICKCFSGYASSDGSGNTGNRGDCGYIEAII